MDARIRQAPLIEARGDLVPRLPSRLPAGLAALLLAVTLTACGSGSTSASSSTVQASSTTTAVGPVDPAAAVLSAYRAMWADLVTAARTSAYQSPLLPQHASGNALTIFVQGLARDQLAGIVTKGQPVLDPRVTSLTPSVDPTHATLADCFDDTHWVEYKVSGGLANNAPGGLRATTAELVMKDGVWKVTQITIDKTGTC
jgi:hypothetical protein